MGGGVKVDSFGGVRFFCGLTACGLGILPFLHRYLLLRGSSGASLSGRVWSRPAPGELRLPFWRFGPAIRRRGGRA